MNERGRHWMTPRIEDMYRRRYNEALPLILLTSVSQATYRRAGISIHGIAGKNALHTGLPNCFSNRMRSVLTRDAISGDSACNRVGRNRTVRNAGCLARGSLIAHSQVGNAVQKASCCTAQCCCTALTVDTI